MITVEQFNTLSKGDKFKAYGKVYTVTDKTEYTVCSKGKVFYLAEIEGVV